MNYNITQENYTEPLVLAFLRDLCEEIFIQSHTDYIKLYEGQLAKNNAKNLVEKNYSARIVGIENLSIDIPDSVKSIIQSVIEGVKSPVILYRKFSVMPINGCNDGIPYKGYFINLIAATDSLEH